MVTAGDSLGNAASTFSGMVTVALANNPGGAVLGGTLSATAINGVATFTGLTLNQTGTNFTLQVTSGNLTPATTSGISVTTVTATHLVVTMQPPGSITAGNGFGLTVTAEDGSGNAAPSFNTPITVGLAGGAGTVLLGGTLTATPSNGVASFGNLTLNAGGSFALVVSGGGLSATTSTINVTAPPATRLVVTTQPPGNTGVNATFGLTVTAVDFLGNVDTAYGGTVSVALTNNAGAQLGGTVNATPSRGVAVFTGLTLNQAGTGYALQVTSGNLTSAMTSAFNIAAPTTTFLVRNANDSGPGSLREAIANSNSSFSAGNSISFNVAPGGLVAIALNSPLPPITVPVVLNGETQVGFHGTPIVVLNGKSIATGGFANGLTIFAGNSTVKGLVIDGFSGAGIQLALLGNNVIQDDYIGVDLTGTQRAANAGDGIQIVASPQNTIGGTSPGALERHLGQRRQRRRHQRAGIDEERCAGEQHRHRCHRQACPAKHARRHRTPGGDANHHRRNGYRVGQRDFGQPPVRYRAGRVGGRKPRAGEPHRHRPGGHQRAGECEGGGGG